MILKKYIREQNDHNRKVNEFMLNQSLVNTNLTNDLGEVKRGVYGDIKNKVPGLIDRQGTMETDLKTVKGRQRKVYFTAGGIILGFNACIFLVKEFFFKK